MIASLLPCLVLSAVAVLPVEAAVAPPDTPLRAKEFRHPNLHIPSLERPLGELGPAVAGRGLDLVRLGVGAGSGFFDWRGARWSSLILSHPLIPGDGKGNVMGSEKLDNAKVWKALSDWLRDNQGELRVDLAELASPSIGIFSDGNLVQVWVPRVVDGVIVRDSGLRAVISHGNLILLGLRNWGTLDASPKARIGAAEAEAAVTNYLQPFQVASQSEKPRLELIPMSAGETAATVAAGHGYDYRLCWVLTSKVNGDIGTWESLVDATTGRLIAFQDVNQYASRKALGGVYPKSNDQKPPDGVEQSGWPMPCGLHGRWRDRLRGQRRSHELRFGHGHHRAQRQVHEDGRHLRRGQRVQRLGRPGPGLRAHAHGHGLHGAGGPLGRRHQVVALRLLRAEPHQGAGPRPAAQQRMAAGPAHRQHEPQPDLQRVLGRQRRQLLQVRRRLP
jgi:hypothetical protein